VYGFHVVSCLYKQKVCVLCTTFWQCKLVTIKIFILVNVSTNLKLEWLRDCERLNIIHIFAIKKSNKLLTLKRVRWCTHMPQLCVWCGKLFCCSLNSRWIFRLDTFVLLFALMICIGCWNRHCFMQLGWFCTCMCVIINMLYWWYCLLLNSLSTLFYSYSWISSSVDVSIEIKH